MLIIDSHQHIWDPAKAEYTWLEGAPESINRAFTSEEILPRIKSLGMTGTVMVQAADNQEDTDLMVQAAADNPEVLGIVGYLPLAEPDVVRARVGEYVEDPLMVGVRNLIHTYANPDWVVSDAVGESLAVLARNGLTFDVVAVLPAHLAHVPTLASRYPTLRLVVDHLAKPPIGHDDWALWKSQMSDAAAHPNVYAKVSGLYPGDDMMGWDAPAIRPFVHDALELFGPDRLMFGGDWPISVMAGDYERVWEGLSNVFDELTDAERVAILGETCRDFYRLDERRVAAAIVLQDQHQP